MVQMATNEVLCNGVDLSQPNASSLQKCESETFCRDSDESHANSAGMCEKLSTSEDRPETSLVTEEATKLEERLSKISELEDTIKRLEICLANEQEKTGRLSHFEEIIQRQEKQLELCQKERDIDTRTISALKNELDAKVTALKKQCETANKDKENMIVRYALSEKELLDQKKSQQTIEKKLKDAVKESENLGNKVKSLSAEKAKLAQSLDTKTSEVANAYKEIDKLKDEINSRDIKIKWTQNKLKSELEAHKDCAIEIDKMQKSVNDLKKDIEDLVEENASLKSQLEGSEINKNFEIRLKELSDKVEEERKTKLDSEANYLSVISKNEKLSDENSELSFQVQSLEQDKDNLKRTIERMTEERETLKENLKDLGGKLLEFDNAVAKLEEEKSLRKTLEEEIERLRAFNSELSVDIASCRGREGEMLSLTEQLTAKNAEIQAKFLGLESEVEDLKCKNSRLSADEIRLRDTSRQLEEDFRKEKDRRVEETKLLAREAAEQRTKAQQLETALMDAQAELTLLRNKHAVTLKELQRELKSCRKKIEDFESSPGNFSTLANDSSSTSSPASSLTSLNNDNNVNIGTSSGGISCQVLDVPAQTLVERIVKLQNECAKQTERIEFLEDHSERLVKKLQKKTRLLQNYIMREPTGALSSKSMDKNKAEVAKHGGIMASLYSPSKPADETMTLELSLEINRKLQAVLEDTLLKNITLKENLDTLGDEIARLSAERK